MVEQAQELARLAPVDREYMPTLGPQKYEPTRRYVEETATLSLADRARAVDEALAASEKAKVISAGFHQAQAAAGAEATKNGNFNYERSTIASLGMTARTPDGAGSGYFLRSHIDIRRVDTRLVYREAIRRAQESRGARTHRRRKLSGDSRSAGRRRPDLGVLVELRRPLRRGRPQRVLRAPADGQGLARRCSTSGSTSSAIHGVRTCPARRPRIRPAVAGRLPGSQRRARESRLQPLLGRAAETPADAGTGQPHHPGERPPRRPSRR